MSLVGKYSHEISYWGNCCNTFDEEQKQFVYAEHMGIERQHFSFDAKGRGILDIGGGPTSMLLKSINLCYGLVADPLMMSYPEWVRNRYSIRGLAVLGLRGEDLIFNMPVDEVWIYNVLQHTDEPEKIIGNALRIGKRLRIFEWINIPPHDGHPHELRQEDLDSWIGSKGSVEVLNDRGCVGTAYFGNFLGHGGQGQDERE